MTLIKRTSMAALIITGLLGGLHNANAAEGGKKHEVEKKVMKLNSDPVFKKKGNYILMNLLNLDQNAVVIKVVDGSGRVVFFEKLEGEMIIEKAFNFEKAFENDYTLIVKEEGKTFRKKISIK